MISNLPPALLSILKLNLDQERAKLRLRFWHVETNLNRAADLLDRCIVDRATYLDLQTKSKFLSLTLQEEAEKLRDNEERVSSGYLENNALEAKKKGEMLTDSLDLWNLMHKNLEAAQVVATVDLQKYQAAAEVYRSGIIKKSMLFDCIASRTITPLLNDELRRIKSNNIEAKKRINIKSEFLEPEGELSYLQQSKVIAEKIQRDIVDAFERLQIASEGLNSIFGYTDIFLPVSTPYSKFGPIDYAILWVREAIRWLMTFSQLDQTFSATISMREVLKKKWDIAITKSPVFFKIPDNLMSNHRYIRLRGISAYSVIKNDSRTRMIRAKLTLPKYGEYIFDSSLAKDTISNIDQSGMPDCILGSIRDITIPISPEVVGGISLTNASPIGKAADENGMWKVTFDCSDFEDKAISDISDIYIEFKLSGRPR